MASQDERSGGPQFKLEFTDQTLRSCPGIEIPQAWLEKITTEALRKTSFLIRPAILAYLPYQASHRSHPRETQPRYHLQAADCMASTSHHSEPQAARQTCCVTPLHNSPVSVWCAADDLPPAYHRSRAPLGGMAEWGRQALRRCATLRTWIRRSCETRRRREKGNELHLPCVGGCWSPLISRKAYPVVWWFDGGVHRIDDGGGQPLSVPNAREGIGRWRASWFADRSKTESRILALLRKTIGTSRPEVRRAGGAEGLFGGTGRNPEYDRRCSG